MKYPMVSQTAEWDGEKWVYGTMSYGPETVTQSDCGRIVEVIAEDVPDYEGDTQEVDSPSTRERRRHDS